MRDERNARPVSGEIMTGEASATELARQGPQGADVIDAEFETLRPDPADRLGPGASISPIGTCAIPSLGLGSLSKSRRSHAVKRGPTRGGPLFWSVGMAIALGAFWVSGGHALMRAAATETAVTPVNPLRISKVNSRVERHGDRNILFVDGSAINDGAEQTSLPAIAISVTDNGGSILHYRLGTVPDLIGPRSHFNFSTRLEAPKEGVKTVSVAFSG